VVGIAVNTLFFAALSSSIPSAQGHGDPFSLTPSLGGNLALVICVPVGVIISLYLRSGLIHLGLLMVKGDRHGFDATFRTVAYCQSLQIFAIIPVVGGVIAGAWTIVSEICGIMEMQKTTGGKATFSVLWVLGLALVCCGSLLVLLFGVAGAGALR